MFSNLIFLVTFFSIIFLTILVCSILLTINNNKHFKNTLSKGKQYDEKRSKHRSQLMNVKYTQRFGDVKIRHNTKYYSVSPSQNLDTYFVNKLYKQES